MMRLALSIFFLTIAFNAWAQSWPSRPIRMVVPLSPGGFADVPGRILAARLSSLLGYNVFVENRPGAGGTIGADFVAKSAPDGYTLLFTGTPHVISAWIYKTLPYDPLKDFEPVALVASGPYVLVVNPQLPVHSVRELIGAAKAQPGKIDYASSGNGSAQHLVSALFASMAGIELNHVPYKGSGPAMQDLLGGQVKVSFAGIPNVLPHVKAGRLRALAVSTPQRSPDLPDVPTAAEAGVPGYQATLWLNLAAPAGTPSDVVQRIYVETAKALQDTELQQNFRAAGVEASPMSPQELAGFMRAEYEKWGKVVRATGATVN
jgi:tripartite-type tricarboxylate transporter receptor subunit TctC